MEKYIYDIETYPDAFVAVFKRLGDSSRDAYRVFVCADFEERNDLLEMTSFLLDERPALIGYNNISFDAQIVEMFIQGRLTTAAQAYMAAQSLIEEGGRRPFREEELSNHNLDLYLVGSYNTPARRTSLKWLEYTLRMSALADLPYHHEETIRTRPRLEDVVRYCKKDVLATESVYLHHDKEVEMRRGVCAKYGRKLLNMSNSQIGEYIILHEYCEKTGRTVYDIEKSRRSFPSLKVGDLILPSVEFKTPALQEIHEAYKNLRLKANEFGEIPIKGAFSRSLDWSGAHTEFGVGGIHGQATSGLYKSGDGMVIVTADVASMYPNLAIKNSIFPVHMGIEYCEVYEGVYFERKKHDKGTALNLAYKEALNSTFGKSNSQYSPLFDPSYFLRTTINGQLLLSMYAEQLMEIGQPIMLNTDGVEFLIPESNMDAYREISSNWEAVSGLELEHDVYDWIAMRDVNNYIAKTESGKVKRKGVFLTYNDYEGDWHKNPSFTIIPKAVNEYFLNGTEIRQTIMAETNVFEFMAGVKGKKNFEYWMASADEKGLIDIERFSERAIRYYISMEGGTMMKYYNDGRKNLLQKVTGTSNYRTKIAQKVNKSYTEYFPDINYQYYIDAAEDLVKSITK